MGQTLAVDLGGTNMRAAAVDATGEILDRAVVPTPRKAATLDPFLDLVQGLAADHDVEHAVVAVPGRVDHQRGLLLHAPNLPEGWAPLLTRAALEDALGRPVALANDADVAAVGEARFGA
ncbi:MAG TPA: ROK family protein, partial [Acidimicrobiia bacterium]|nr:ROK family protein [Acidimicrobiia bacterium]